MKKKLTFGLTLVLFSLLVLSACGSKKLSGDYTAKINLLLTEETVTLRFKDDKVFEINDSGEEKKEATYEINDNELKMKYPDDITVDAVLSKDKKSFTIKATDDLSGIFINNVKFTKKEK
ncbi:hypothetical protein [Vagococcus hydrophili]|uniref:Lipoprotein n=1 Tax=Vagococcus hydrophili TaxID=2714947 RepID=A0A6G8ATF6_9ENTE|nr:hypothetical protein [Vagococcus hydrophili]QIL48358.1 hypothetical protein G7082_07550 [Vagococcus hydrophili]